MKEPQRKPVRVTRTSDQRAPQGVRRLGRALIALAQAQAEAEAEAEAKAGASGTKPPRPKAPADSSSHPTGDAA